MKSPLDEFARTQATGWFRAIERDLGEIFRLDTRTRLAMESLEAEFKATNTRSSQTYHVKRRDGKSLPDAIHRVRICGSREMPEGVSRPSGTPYRHWVEHLKGPPTHDEMYFQAKDVSLLELFESFHSRSGCLNSARHALVLGRESIEHRAMAWAEPRVWDAGELASPAPLLLTTDLPPTSLRALGAAWRVCLRMAALQFELFALAERHNGNPPYRGLRLAFRIDREHPYGRFVWTLHGQRLSRLARQLAKGEDPGRIEDASLPDRLMRRLGIPTPARKAITVHERHRRRMARIYERYVTVVDLLLGAGPRRLKEAQKLLEQAGYPASPAIAPGRDSVCLNN